MNDLLGLGIGELRRALTAGAVRPDEPASAALAAIAKHQSTLNAFVETRESVLRAGDGGGPLAGVPIAIKDCFFDGGRTPTMGSRAHPELRAGTADVIRRLEGAGAAIVGYANLHEWAVAGTSAVTATGPIRNPWDGDLIAGGSSGGSAAAVAAGLVPAAIGTDAGGSIRIPAACCGVVGLKPSRGSVPMRGYVGEGAPTDHIGPLGRNCDDVAILFEVLSGRGPSDREASTMRIGIASGPDFDDVDPAVATAVDNAMQGLRRLCEGSAELRVDFRRLARANGRLFLSDVAQRVRTILDDRPELFMPPTRELLERARAFTPEDMHNALTTQEEARRSWAAMFDAIDVLLTPTIPVLPPRIDDPKVTLPSGDYDGDSVVGSLNGAMNLVGYPSLSVPCGDAGHLSVSMSLTAAPGNEGWLLNLGRAFEEETDRMWADRVAPL